MRCESESGPAGRACYMVVGLVVGALAVVMSCSIPLDSVGQVDASGTQVDASDTEQDASCGPLCSTDPFQVNSEAEEILEQPSVALAADGRFLVAWHRRDPLDSSMDYDIHARLYDASGQAVGPQFQVNATAVGKQEHAVVAANVNGDFVVTWMSNHIAANDWDIYARLVGVNGQPVGNEFRVNTVTQNRQMWQDVAVDASGRFVVAWKCAVGQNGVADQIKARRFDASGNPLGEELLASSYPESYKSTASVGVAPDGRFVVVWDSGSDQDGDACGIFGQRFDAQAQPVGTEMQLNAMTAGYQSMPNVAMDADGSFLVAWESFSGQPDGWWVRRFGPDGTAQGDEIIVGGLPEMGALLESPTVAVAIGNGGEGRVVYGYATSDPVVPPPTGLIDVVVRRIDATGQLVGNPIQANSPVTIDGEYMAPQADIAATPDGRVVVVWREFGFPMDVFSFAAVYGQRYDTNGNPIGISPW